MTRLLILLFLFSGQWLNAQEKILDFPTGKKYHKSFVQENGKGDFILTLTKGNGLKRFLVSADSSKEINEVESFELVSKEQKVNPDPREDNRVIIHEHQTYLGGHYANNTLIEAFLLPRQKNIVLLETDISTKTIACSDTVRYHEMEKFITGIVQKNVLYLLFYRSASNDLIIHKKIVGSKIETKRLNINPQSTIAVKGGILGSRRIRKFSEVFEDGQFAVMQNGLNYPTYISSYKKKLFVQDDKIIFCLSAEDLINTLITIDLKNWNTETKLINQTGNEPSLNGFPSSSVHLLDSFMFTAHISYDKLSIKQFNWHTGSLIKSYLIDDANYMSIIGRPPLKVGDLLSPTNEKGVSISQFINYAHGYNLSVCGYSIGEEIYLRIGTPYTRTSLAMLGAGILLSAASTYAINVLPNTFGFSAVFFHEYGGNLAITFTLNPEDDTKKLPHHVTGGDVWKKMISFAKENNIKGKEVDIFSFKTNYYLGYFDKQGGKYNLHRFKVLENGN